MSRVFSRKLFAILLTVLFLCLLTSCAAPPAQPAQKTDPAPQPVKKQEIFLWPGVAPGSEGLQLVEKSEEGGGSALTRGLWVSKILRPSLTAFIPAKCTGAAALIIPGGSYQQVAFDKEGTEIATWLNSQGVAAFVLKYRFPIDGHKNSQHVALQDAQRAIRVIRQQASSLGLDPAKIGVVGSSAGGHVAATLGTSFAREVYDPVDDSDKLSARPAFMVLIYPAISYEGPTDHLPSIRAVYDEYPTDKLVTKETPRTFMVVADDDYLPDHSARFYRALRAAQVPAELHIFAKGGHGFGMRSEEAIKRWPELCAQWLREYGFAL